MWDAIIGAGSKLLGGFMDQDAAKDKNALTLQLANQEAARQREFAQNAISWKVADARNAGVHPLYALGANTVSYSPQTIGLEKESGVGSALADAGQDLSRAFKAQMPAEARVSESAAAIEKLSVQRAGLENELLATKIAREKSQLPPPLPIPIDEKKKAGDRPQLYVGGNKISTDPLTSNQEDFETRYGDDGPVSWATQAAIAWRDLQHNMSGMSFPDILRAIDRATQLNMPDWFTDRRHRGGPPQYR